MQPQKLVDVQAEHLLPDDRIYRLCGNLLALRLRFRANCRALHAALAILTDEDFVERFETGPVVALDRFPELLRDHRFAREFGSCFSSSYALGQCIDGIRIAWQESDNLLADARRDFADPIYQTWPTARAALMGFLTAIGRGDYYVASVLDWHNGLSGGCEESVTALNDYLVRLEHWVGLRA